LKGRRIYHVIFWNKGLTHPFFREGFCVRQVWLASFLPFISRATRYSTLAVASGLHLLLEHPCDLGLGDIPGRTTTLIHSDDQSLRLI